ncbi:unnamed protein product [Cuscuta epithymum]|uniref:Expansin n=1 Tax=Cuscuta epithymum TaxID=186058 RepID=A0AAV0E5M1_9ASTE|nr:unnamed protein product [Cuscuta epithymum]
MTTADSIIMLSVAVVLVVLPCTAFAAPGGWKGARATFYGAPQGTIGGACGYEPHKQAYGAFTTALSMVLYNKAGRCGACYEIRCVNNKFCKPGGHSVVVTATDFCPPNFADSKAWCNSPNPHFDLSQPAFLQLAEYKAGVVPVQYRRVPCKRKGGARFTIEGNTFFNLVTVTNVGGAGDIARVDVQAEGTRRWIPLKRNWGEKWETDEKLAGKALTFRVTTSDGRVLAAHNVAPKAWQFGQTYQGRQNL